MIEKIAIAAIVLAAIVVFVRKLYLWLSGRGAPCSGCGKSACLMQRPKKDS